MSESPDRLAILSEGADAVLDDLVEVLTARLQAGESVDLDEVACRHPEHVERLRRLLPALVMMANLGESSSRELEGLITSGAGPGAGVLGDFRIVREIGRGGMGIVYEAEQLSLDRRVALKVLPLAATMDGKQLQRFQLEAHAAACLHHTNIVPVHGVGCERGVPFYAMQFIEGRSLAQLIADLRRLECLDAADKPDADLAEVSTSTLAASLASGRLPDGARPPVDRHAGACEDEQRGGLARGERLPGPEVRTPTPRPGGELPSGSSIRNHVFIRTAARLGVQVAEALDHAHTSGILHRDIKPANLLLDNQGRLWVTDFGLAQIQGHPALTLTGDILGTLRYMSPEQALARRVVIDGRTDIYSLGVTLYELLTLRPAIDGRDRQEILRKIAEEEPVGPRKLNPAVPRDLETILLKAMAKEPSGRYATAKDLADELRRFLEHRPILARRPSPLDRAAKWARRHRPLVASISVATLLFLGLAILVLASTNLRIQEERERADGERERAEASSRKAREVVDRMFTRVAQDLQHTPRMEKIRRALLEDALEFYQGFLKEKSSDPTVRHETARAYMRVAKILVVLGRSPQALEPWERASALLEGLTAEFPGVADYWRDLAACHRGKEQVYSLEYVNDGDRAAEASRAELRIREKLAAEFPNVPDYRRELARKYSEFGVRLEERSASEGEVLHRKALDIWDRLRRDFPEVPEDWYGRAGSLGRLGSLLMHTNRFPEAEQELRKALPLAEQAVAANPESPDFRSELALLNRFLGDALASVGRAAEAVDHYRRSIRLNESLAGDFPDTPRYRAGVLWVSGTLGDSLRAIGRLQEAESCLRRAIELATTPDGSGSDGHEWAWGVLYEKLGLVYHASGHDHEAADAFRQALTRYEKEDAVKPDVHWQKFLYAKFLTSCPAGQFRDPERAVALAKRALQRVPQSRWGWQVLGEAEYRSGHWEAAIEGLRNAMKFGTKDDPSLVLYLAMASWRLGRKAESIGLYDQAVGLIRPERSRDEGLTRLRIEAAALLGLPRPTTPAKQEVSRPHGALRDDGSLESGAERI
jgi:serine/threonine-protein kinase